MPDIILERLLNKVNLGLVFIRCALVCLERTMVGMCENKYVIHY